MKQGCIPTKWKWKTCIPYQVENTTRSGCIPHQCNGIQLSTSSQSKKWGAYFSVVCGWNSVPICATEAHGHRVCNRLLGFYPLGTFVLPHTCTHHPLIHGRCQQYLFRSRSIGFLSKQIQSTCFSTNPVVNAHGGGGCCVHVWGKEKNFVNKKQALHSILCAHMVLWH